MIILHLLLESLSTITIRTVFFPSSQGRKLLPISFGLLAVLSGHGLVLKLLINFSFGLSNLHQLLAKLSCAVTFPWHNISSI